MREAAHVFQHEIIRNDYNRKIQEDAEGNQRQRLHGMYERTGKAADLQIGESPLKVING